MRHARDTVGPRSATIPTPPRRGLLTATIAALLTGVPIARAVPAAADAALIRLCTEFHRLNAAMAVWPADDDDGFEAKMAERHGVSDRIVALSAATDAGRREKAAVALAVLSENCGSGEGFTIRTTLAVLRDIAGRSGA